MPGALAPIAGAVVGGLMSDGGGGQQTASKEPWAEAAPWLKQHIKTGQDLQQYYQQNPFNPMQQTGYQNLFSDLDHFRNQMAPGLMQMAGNAMSGGYQRPQYSKPGDAGYGGNQNQSMGPGAGLGGLLAVAAPTARSSYGLLDFKELNPFTAQNGIPKAPVQTPEQLAEEERKRREQAMQEDAMRAYMASERLGAGA